MRAGFGEAASTSSAFAPLILHARISRPLIQSCTMGDEAEVLEHMLLAEDAGENLLAVGLAHDQLAEDLLHEVDPERRVQHRPVAHVGKVRLHLVKPLVERVVVAGDAAEAAGAGLGALAVLDLA